MRKGIGNKKIRKSGNGNVFQKLIKIVVNLFGKKILLFFVQQTQKSYHVWASFLTKKREQDPNYSCNQIFGFELAGNSLRDAGTKREIFLIRLKFTFSYS